MIKIGVIGALGKMGKEVVKAVLNDTETELVSAVDVFSQGSDIGEIVSGKKCNVLIETDLEKELKSVSA